MFLEIFYIIKEVVEYHTVPMGAVALDVRNTGNQGLEWYLGFLASFLPFVSLWVNFTSLIANQFFLHNEKHDH